MFQNETGKFKYNFLSQNMLIPCNCILLSLYLSYINAYVSYVNITWASTHETNLKNIHNQQKHNLRIVHNKDIFYYTKERFRSCNVLNVDELNLANTFIFKHKIKTVTCPTTFDIPFEIPTHTYISNMLFRQKLLYAKKTGLRKKRFLKSIRGKRKRDKEQRKNSNLVLSLKYK